MSRWNSLAAIFAVLVALATPDAAGAQTFRPASGAEGALLGRLTDLDTWLGTLSGDLDGAAVVGMVLIPVDGVDLRGGDVIARINGTPVTGRRALARAYDAIPVGGRVRLAVRRGGQPITVEFAKPDPASVPRLSLESIPVPPSP